MMTNILQKKLCSQQRYLTEIGSSHWTGWFRDQWQQLMYFHFAVFREKSASLEVTQPLKDA
jgi:hypothetical protein